MKLNRGQVLGSMLLLMMLLLESCSVIFPIIAPFDDLPTPTGPYTVGTRTTVWVDSSRDETFTQEIDQRKIVVQIWFPLVGGGQGSPSLYIDSPELRLPAIAKQLRLPVTLFKHFDEVKTNSYIDDPAAQAYLGFPVLLFSHGLSGMRFQNTALMEELASQGYVIFAADHSYEANITIFPGGSTAEYKAGKRRVLTAELLENIDLTQLSIIVSDLSFMLDQIDRGDTIAFLKNIPLDLNKVGVIGHSLGGAAILNTMAVDERIQAAMVLDGWYIPVPDSIISRGITQPVFHLGQQAWSDSNNYLRMDQMLSHSSGPIFKLLIPGTSHTDFTDMPLFTPFSFYIGYTSAENPEWLNQLIRASTVRFFDTYLKGYDVAELVNLIQAEKGASSSIFIPPIRD